MVERIGLVKSSLDKAYNLFNISQFQLFYCNPKQSQLCNIITH